VTLERCIKDYYEEFYNSKDKEGKKMLTQHVNLILDLVPPRIMAMAMVALQCCHTKMMDAKELNQNEDKDRGLE
jgi:hypothetical protein